MKKLMIAAAAVAMIGAAQADEIPVNYKLFQAGAELDQAIVLGYKEKADMSNFVKLDSNKKDFGKTLKLGSQVVDGVYYYSANDNSWMNFEWSKDGCKACKKVPAPTYDLYINDASNSVIAVIADTAWYDKKNEKFVAEVYGTCKVTKDKETGAITAIDNFKSLKCTTGYVTFSVADCTKKASRTATAEANTAAAIAKKVESYWKKANKVDPEIFPID